MKRTLTILILSLLVAVTAFAQQGQQKPAEAKPDAKPAAKLPTVDQVLDKYVQAIGGKAAIEKQTSRVAKGTFELPAFGGERHCRSLRQGAQQDRDHHQHSWVRSRAGSLRWKNRPVVRPAGRLA